MKALIAVMTLFITFSSFALEDFNGKKYEVVTLENDRDVNIECLKKDCIAKVIEVKPGRVLDGEDPAAVACIETLKGSPLQLHDGEFNERSFCVFSDNSMLGFGSIRAELIQ